MNANQTVMTDLNLNHVWVTHAELLLKDTFVKKSFMFVTIFFRYENPERKNFINWLCPKHPKIITWNKKWPRFL